MKIMLGVSGGNELLFDTLTDELLVRNAATSDTPVRFAFSGILKTLQLYGVVVAPGDVTPVTRRDRPRK